MAVKMKKLLSGDRVLRVNAVCRPRVVLQKIVPSSRERLDHSIFLKNLGEGILQKIISEKVPNFWEIAMLSSAKVQSSQKQALCVSVV